MPQFNYIARDKNGQSVTGIIDKADRIQAIKNLEYQGFTPISIIPVDPPPSTSATSSAISDKLDSLGSFARTVQRGLKGKGLLVIAVVLVMGACIINTRQGRQAEISRHDREIRTIRSREPPSQRASQTSFTANKTPSEKPGRYAQPVVTNRAEAIKAFGQPSGDVSSSDGKTILYFGTSGKVELQNDRVIAITGDFSPPRPQPKTPMTYPALSADVNGLSRYVFTIANRNNYNWTDVELIINPGFFSKDFRLKIGSISSGSSYTVTVKDFIAGDGTRFSPDKSTIKDIAIHAEDPAGHFQQSYFCPPQ